MDDLLRLAYETRERLRRELAIVETMIADRERLESSTRPLTPANYELRLESGPSPQRRRSPQAELKAVLDAAEAQILKAGKPLSRSELVGRLEQGGFDFPGGDKTKVFGTNLWRSRRFLSLKGLGYWPEAHPLPAAYRTAEQRSSMLREER